MRERRYGFGALKETKIMKNKAKLLPQGFDLSFLYVFLSGPSAASVLLFIGDEKQGIGTRAALKKWPRLMVFLGL